MCHVHTWFLVLCLRDIVSCAYILASFQTVLERFIVNCIYYTF